MYQQFFRYGVVGIGSSALYALVYLLLNWLVLTPREAIFAVPPAFLVAATFGFFVNRCWSFRYHHDGTGTVRRFLRYLVAQASGMVLNLGFTWATTVWLGLRSEVSLIPSFLITPFLSYMLQRAWVFGRS